MKLKNYVFRAVIDLAPGAEFGVKNDDISTLEWHDKILPRPSDEDILSKIEELKQFDEANGYQEIRSRSYPSVASQLDTLWHMMDDGTIPGKDSKWYNDILEVKQRYPKDMKVVE